MEVAADIPATVRMLRTAKANKTFRIDCEDCLLGSNRFMAIPPFPSRTHNSVHIAENLKIAVILHTKRCDASHREVLFFYSFDKLQLFSYLDEPLT
jgi:hypothetical protein